MVACAAAQEKDCSTSCHAKEHFEHMWCMDVCGGTTCVPEPLCSGPRGKVVLFSPAAFSWRSENHEKAVGKGHLNPDGGACLGTASIRDHDSKCCPIRSTYLGGGGSLSLTDKGPAVNTVMWWSDRRAVCRQDRYRRPISGGPIDFIMRP